jgi:hypothetical protein
MIIIGDKIDSLRMIVIWNTGTYREGIFGPMK